MSRRSRVHVLVLLGVGAAAAVLAWLDVAAWWIAIGAAVVGLVHVVVVFGAQHPVTRRVLTELGAPAGTGLHHCSKIRSS